LAVAVGLAACGGGEPESVVVARVGGHPITKAALARQMSAIAPQHLVPDPPRYTKCVARQEALSPQSIRALLKEECQRQYHELLERALGYMISSYWLIGEAADEGLTSRDHGVQALTVRAQLAAVRIRQRLTANGPTVTDAQILEYYTRHMARFEHRERRYLDIVERFASAAAARNAMRMIARGQSLARFAPYHEEFDRPSISDVVPKKRAVMRAIFAASPHVLVGPVALNGYSVFEVTRITPRVLQPLAQVKGSIEQRLGGEQLRRVIVAFVARWRSKWIARTDCLPEYVIQKCKSYDGVRTTEDPTTLG
jgi:hypothetical protein